MKIKSISFKNYKAFFYKQKIELKPITILIGKNSSGKSSIAKLFTLLEKSLSGTIDEPLLLKNNNVELGSELHHLFFGNNPGGFPLEFSIEYEDKKLELSLFKNTDKYGLSIHQWKYNDFKSNIEIGIEKKDGLIYSDLNTTNEYKCTFKGFCSSSFINNKTGENKNYQIDSIDVDYIGPFRIIPDRVFHLSGQTSFQHTGVAGENAYAMLAVSMLDKAELHEKVGEWYQSYFNGWKLKVSTTYDWDLKGGNNATYFQILLSKNNIDVNLVDVGQGMNQALPLVVRANIKRENSIIVLEQPELHLHPAAHGDLMQLFAKSAKENNQTFIIETHSENMLLRLRRLIVEDTEFNFNKDDVIIYWVEDHAEKGQELRKITIDEEGNLSDWPSGVFNESVRELFAIDKALMK
jgi:AAA15 family ATPase/GTPase